MSETDVYRSATGVSVRLRRNPRGDHADEITVEPTQRWIRAKIGDTKFDGEKDACSISPTKSAGLRVSVIRPTGISG